MLSEKSENQNKEVSGSLTSPVTGSDPSGPVEFENSDSETQKDLSSLPLWKCRIGGKPGEGQWTVGEIFNLECEGPRVEFLSTDLQFKSKDESQYKLCILEVLEDSGYRLQLKATSYNAGSHRFEKLYIVDQGEEMVRIEPLGFDVKSVIKNPMQKPFGPVMAVKLPYPSWLWMTFVLFFFTGVFCFLFWWRRKVQMLRVIEELKQHNTALGPFNQLNKDLRHLERESAFKKTDQWSNSKKQSYIESLDHVFRMYLLREFYVPALDWSSSLVIKTLSSQDKRYYRQYGGSLKKFLQELDRAKRDFEKIRDQDCRQLTRMAKKVSQSIWNLKRSSSK